MNNNNQEPLTTTNKEDTNNSSLLQRPKKHQRKTHQTNSNNPPAAVYSAEQKAQAILAVWTEKCRVADVCRQLHISYMTFLQWQDRAMEGMLQALEARVNLARGQVLSPKLQMLLEKRQRSASFNKLNRRLEQIQLAKTNPQELQQPQQ